MWVRRVCSVFHDTFVFVSFDMSKIKKKSLNLSLNPLTSQRKKVPHRMSFPTAMAQRSLTNSKCFCKVCTRSCYLLIRHIPSIDFYLYAFKSSQCIDKNGDQSIGPTAVGFLSIVSDKVNYFEITAQSQHRMSDGETTLIANGAVGSLKSRDTLVECNNNFILLTVPMRCFCCDSICFMFLVEFLCCLNLYNVRFHIFI